MTQETSSTEATHGPGDQPPRIAERGIVVKGLRLATAMNDAPPELKSRVPLVVLPAAGFAWDDYRPILEHFGGERRVFALDWPGFGTSAKPSPADFAYGAAAYAELLEPWLNTLGAPRVVLLGNGIGGAAALRFAVAHPDRVLGLFLVAPSGFAPAGIARMLATRLLGVPALLVRIAPLLANLALGPATPETRAVLAALKSRRIAGRDNDGGVLAEAALWRSLGQPDADLAALAHQVSTSAMLVRGALDPLFSAGDARRATESIGVRGAVEVVLPGAGHLPFLQQSRRFYQALAGMLGAAEYRAAALS
jgi:pimeloyl-ACP methyl ester carboxylesterase